MKKIKYLLFFIPFLFTLNVYATDYNISSKIKYNVSLPGGSYGADDLTDGYNTVMGRYTVGTRYNGRIGYMEFFVSGEDFNASTNHTYTITLNMATNDWRNNFMGPIVSKCNSDGSVQTTNSHLTVSNFRFISRKQIKFNFKTNSSLSPYYKFVLYSNNYASQGGTAITGETNWNLSSIIISDNVSSGGSSGGSSTPTPTPTPSASNKDIIDNANQNTDDIINNNNQNTTDIIDNANNNTNVLNDSINNVCKDTTITIGEDLSMRKGFILDGDNGGVEVQYNGGLISKYLKLKPGTSYTISRITGGSQPTSIGYCLYNANKTVYTCGLMPGENSSITINADNYATYLRVSFVGYRVTQVSGYICNDFQNETISEVGQSVIDGAQNIIDNVNSGSQNIINNANQNAKDTQDVINNNFNNCVDSRSYTDKDITLDNYRFTNSSGYKSFHTGSGIVEFVPILKNTSYSITNLYGASYYCLYNDAKSLISCSSYNSRPSVSFNSENASYISLSLLKGRTFFLEGKYCSNRLDDTTNAINDVNKNLTDETTPDIDLDLDLDTSSPVSDLLTMPITILNKVFDSSDDTCEPYVLPFDFSGGNNTLSLPCINLRDFLGNSVYNVLDTILCFYLCYQIGLMCISIYEDITSLRDGFDGLYTPKHHDTSTRVGRGELEGKY